MKLVLSNDMSGEVFLLTYLVGIYETLLEKEITVDYIHKKINEYLILDGDNLKGNGFDNKNIIELINKINSWDASGENDLEYDIKDLESKTLDLLKKQADKIEKQEWNIF